MEGLQLPSHPIGEGPFIPGQERLADDRGRRLGQRSGPGGVTGGQPGLGFVHGVGCVLHVDAGVGQLQLVATEGGMDHPRAVEADRGERAPNLGDDPPQGGLPRRRQRGGPEGLGQFLLGNGTVPRPGQHGEDDAALAAAERPLVERARRAVEAHGADQRDPYRSGRRHRQLPAVRCVWRSAHTRPPQTF